MSLKNLKLPIIAYAAPPTATLYSAPLDSAIIAAEYTMPARGSAQPEVSISWW
jgi:hypothetical protein